MCQVCVRTHVTYVCGFEPPHLSLGDAREGHTSYLYKHIPIIVFIELVCIMVCLYYVLCLVFVRVYIGVLSRKRQHVFCVLFDLRVACICSSDSTVSVGQTAQQTRTVVLFTSVKFVLPCFIVHTCFDATAVTHSIPCGVS